MPPVVKEDERRLDTLTAHRHSIEHAIQVMHSHLHEPLSLEDLASDASMSPSYFHRVFCRLIGIPPGEFLAALRFQTARRLLVTTQLSVTDICFQVGYTSTGSFTTRFTHLVGLSPRSLRQRARAFEPSLVDPIESLPEKPHGQQKHTALIGRINAPTAFRGMIYVGLFTSPIPQGKPARCTRLSSPGMYLLPWLADGVYYLRAAAFPLDRDSLPSLFSEEKMLVASSAEPLVILHGQAIGTTDLFLHPPRLIDPPLVMGLPLL